MKEAKDLNIVTLASSGNRDLLLGAVNYHHHMLLKHKNHFEQEASRVNARTLPTIPDISIDERRRRHEKASAAVNLEKEMDAVSALTTLRYVSFNYGQDIIYSYLYLLTYFISFLGQHHLNVLRLHHQPRM